MQGAFWRTMKCGAGIGRTWRCSASRRNFFLLMNQANLHRTLNWPWIHGGKTPLKRQTNPVQEPSITSKSITPGMVPPLATWAKRNKRNSVSGALASPQSKVTSMRKSREDKGKATKENKKEKQKKDKRKTKETVFSRSLQLPSPLPLRPISNS